MLSYFVITSLSTTLASLTQNQMSGTMFGSNPNNGNGSVAIIFYTKPK